MNNCYTDGAESTQLAHANSSPTIYRLLHTVKPGAVQPFDNKFFSQELHGKWISPSVNLILINSRPSLVPVATNIPFPAIPAIPDLLRLPQRFGLKHGGELDGLVRVHSAQYGRKSASRVERLGL